MKIYIYFIKLNLTFFPSVYLFLKTNCPNPRRTNAAGREISAASTVIPINTNPKIDDKNPPTILKITALLFRVYLNENIIAGKRASKPLQLQI